jgi:hypothetical protein
MLKRLREAYPSINESSIRVVYQASGRNFEITFNALGGMLHDVRKFDGLDIPSLKCF